MQQDRSKINNRKSKSRPQPDGNSVASRGWFTPDSQRITLEWNSFLKWNAPKIPADHRLVEVIAATASSTRHSNQRFTQSFRPALFTNTLCVQLKERQRQGLCALTVRKRFVCWCRKMYSEIISKGSRTALATVWKKRRASLTVPRTPSNIYELEFIAYGNIKALSQHHALTTTSHSLLTGLC